MNYPFQVMCIEKPVGKHGDVPEIYIGNIYTAIDYVEEWVYHNGQWGKARCYVLAETGKEFGYGVQLFATLPDKSADEMREEEKEAIVNIETHVTV